MKYVFEKAVKVSGVKYAAGDVVAAGAIPAGHLESMLRQGQVSESAESDPAAPFAAAMEAGPRSRLLTPPDGMEFTRVGPSDEDMAAAVAEIEKLRQRCAAMAVENKKLRDENDLLDAELDSLEAAGANKVEAEQPTGGPEKADDKPPEGKPVECKAEPPKVGPAKPPELKAGGKK